ncbi:hypothetical protein PSCICL_23760 [Pseudomonas cichorii]|nr:hypothetical protein PSCICL_23760 [Pseudomonas cichorii]
MQNHELKGFYVGARLPATECEALAKSTTANAADRGQARSYTVPCLLRDSAVPRRRVISHK